MKKNQSSELTDKEKELHTKELEKFVESWPKRQSLLKDKGGQMKKMKKMKLSISRVVNLEKSLFEMTIHGMGLPKGESSPAVQLFKLWDKFYEIDQEEYDSTADELIDMHTSLEALSSRISEVSIELGARLDRMRNRWIFMGVLSGCIPIILLILLIVKLM